MSTKSKLVKFSFQLVFSSLLGLGVSGSLSAAMLKNVASSDSQIVFFNDGSINKTYSANIYVDKHFNTALKPNEYTVFCVAPGQHSLESYLNDAPKYSGKNNPKMVANTQGGHTYFLSVTAQGTPLAVTMDAGTKAIDNAKLSNFINRSPSVHPCAEAEAKPNEFTLTFSFNGSQPRDISSTELINFRDWINTVVAENNYRRIEVSGYSDDIGKQSYNYLLSKRRAKTISNLLIDNGIRSDIITVNAQGDSNIKRLCEGGLSDATKECNQINRRVTVKVIN